MRRVNTKLVTVSMYLETVAKMDEYCKKNLVPKSKLINHLVNEFVDKKNKEK